MNIILPRMILFPLALFIVACSENRNDSVDKANGGLTAVVDPDTQVGAERVPLAVSVSEVALPGKESPVSFNVKISRNEKAYEVYVYDPETLRLKAVQFYIDNDCVKSIGFYESGSLKSQTTIMRVSAQIKESTTIYFTENGVIDKTINATHIDG